MKVVSVILCLIISATTAFADSILWSKAHAYTNLVKDEEWLESALQAEEAIAAEPLLMEATADELKIESGEDPEEIAPQETPTEGAEEQETTDDPEPEDELETTEPEVTESILTPYEIEPTPDDITLDEPIDESIEGD